ncbi:MAG: N-acetylmuramic acid 6-phosphate etherase, partial [Planctomycetota bacterium]
MSTPHTQPDLPPDRSKVLTEQRNPRTMYLHALDVESIVARIQDEDHAIHDAMAAARPALTALISDAEPRFLRGGRIVYLGAGTSGRLGVLDASEAPPTFQVEPGRVVGIIAGGDSALRTSSEHKEDDVFGAREALTDLEPTDNDIVIGIAAGGTTPYPRGALALAKAAAPGCLTALLSCSPTAPP